MVEKKTKDSKRARPVPPVQVSPAPQAVQPPQVIPAEASPEIDLDELSNLSGESTVKQIKYVLPVLKFNGNTGEFSLLRPDNQGNYIPEPKGTTVSGVALKIRRVFTAFEKIPGGSIRYFTNEHNSFRDSLTLFETSKEDRKPRMLDEGSIKKLKEGYPQLRLRQNIYFLYDGEIVKLGVRGKSLASLFDYYKTFDPTEHLFQYITEITSHSEQSEGGLLYYVMDFKRGSESELPKIAERIKEVAQRLALQDKAYQSFPVIEEIPPATEPIRDEEIPIVEEEEKAESEELPLKEKAAEEEVEVKDIPF